MRRGLASLIIGLSLLVASASWAGFTLSHTVLDPGRSERLADQLLENPHVRQVLVNRLADALEDQVPAEVPVSRQLLEAGAERALDDQRVDDLIRDGFVQVHRNALAGNEEPVVIDAGALGPVGREALIQARPELEEFIPDSPTLQLELPTAGLSWIGSVKRVVDRFTTISALVAALGAITAFVVARDRAPVLRRVAFWGYGAAAFWLAIAFGLPRVAETLSPTSAAIATAVADVFFGAMIGPAIAMAVFATVLLIAGLVLPFIERGRGPAALPSRTTTTAGPTVATVGAQGAHPVDNTDRMPLPTRPAHPPVVDHETVGGGQPDWGRQVGIDISFIDPDPDPGITEPATAPTWEPGVGYIEDSARGGSTPTGGPRTGTRDDPGATRRFQP